MSTDANEPIPAPAPPQRRWWHRLADYWVGLVLVAFLAMFIASEVVESQRLRPPQGCNTLDCFAVKMPPPEKLVEFESPETRWFWIGDHKRLLCFPTGPACYVFDSYGRLREWTTETGDGGLIYDEFLLSRDMPSVDVSVALEQIHSPHDEPSPDEPQTSSEL